MVIRQIYQCFHPSKFPSIWYMSCYIIFIIDDQSEVANYNKILSFNRFHIPKCSASMLLARRDILIILKASTILCQQGSGDLSNHISNIWRHLSWIRLQSISSLSIIFDGRSNSSAKSVQHNERSSEYRHNSLSLGLQHWWPIIIQ